MAAWGHINPSIVWGNQKWKGAAPNLSSREVVKMIENRCEENIRIDLAKIIKEDPKAWIKKYFRAASEEYRVFLEIIRGIKDKRFNSRPAQAPNHDDEEVANNIPLTREKKNDAFNEDK